VSLIIYLYIEPNEDIRVDYSGDARMRQNIFETRVGQLRYQFINTCPYNSLFNGLAYMLAINGKRPFQDNVFFEIIRQILDGGADCDVNNLLGCMILRLNVYRASLTRDEEGAKLQINCEDLLNNVIKYCLPSNILVTCESSGCHRSYQ
jgi:hypothetical protein